MEETPLHVVMTGTEEWAVEQVGNHLRHDGHDVVSCFADATPGTSCWAAGGKSETCPAGKAVDVIVAVRAHPLPHLTRRETIVDCPLLSSVPVVLVGTTILNPYGARAVARVEGFEDVAAACHEAAGGRIPQSL